MATKTSSPYKTTTISTQVSTAAGQITSYVEVFEYSTVAFRVSIVTDSYPEQSSARIEAGSKELGRWNEVHSIHYSLMKTPHKLGYYKPERTPADYAADRNELVRVAIAVRFS